MLLSEQVKRIKKLMDIVESKTQGSGLFKKFDFSEFKNFPPPSDNSIETKKELSFLKKIDLKKRFVQEKDDIIGNFTDFLKKHDIDEDSFVTKLSNDIRPIIVELKNYYKRPRPFRLDTKLTDPTLKSMEGFSYPSGHSTQSNLIYLVLSQKYPKLKFELKKIKDDIVFSRQMARAHYPSDIKFGEKLSKSLFNYLLKNNLIN